MRQYTIGYLATAGNIFYGGYDSRVPPRIVEARITLYVEDDSVTWVIQ